MRKKQGKDEETHHDHAHGGVLHHTAETLEGAHLSLEAFELAAMTPARALTVIEKMIENARLVRLTSISEALQEIKTLVNDSKSLVHHGHSFFKVAGPAIVFVNTPIEIASILQQRSNHSSPEENDVITDKTYSVFGENLLRFGMLIPGNQWLLLLNGLDDLLVKPIRGETFKATLSKRWYHKIKEHAELRRIADKLLDDGVRESEDQVIFIDENDFRLKSAVSPVNLGVINDRLRRDQHIVVRKSSGDYVTGIKSRDRWHDVYFNQQRSKEPQGLDFSSEVSIVTDDDALNDPAIG